MYSLSKNIQLTLAIIKPDLVVNPMSVQAITERIVSRDLFIIRRSTLYWTKDDSERFYAQHKGKFFYPRLIEYTTSGPITALLLAGKCAICNWRKLMGPTKTFKANLTHPYTLRGEFGLTDTRNSTHGSDSSEAVREEVSCLFPDFDILRWYREDAEYFISKKIFFHQKSGLHVPDLFGHPSQDVNFAFSGDSMHNQLGLENTWLSYYQDTTTSKDMEWFIEYTQLRSYIHPSIEAALLQKPCEDVGILLDVGCGISLTGPRLANNHKDVAHVYCLDFSQEALHILQERMETEEFENTNNCYFVNCNMIKNIPFNSCTVSAVIDKGTTDAVMRQPEGLKLACKGVHNILRVLHKGGFYIQITDEPPEIRMDFLLETIASLRNSSSYEYSVSWKDISSLNDTEQPTDYFLYIVTKK